MSSYTPVALVQTEQGVELPVWAIAGSSRTEIGGVRDGSLIVRISSAAEKGKANRAIIDLLADVLELRKRDVVLMRGEHHRNKRMLLSGAQMHRVEQILRTSMELPDRPDKENG